MKICLDAGHGGKDVGAVGIVNHRNVYEKNISLSIVLLLQGLLIGAGHKAFLTRRSDRGCSLSSRVSIANRNKVDGFVSVHCNGADNITANGIETWIYPFAHLGRILSLHVHESVITNFPGHINRGIKEADFQVLRCTNMAAILFETEFIVNPMQARFLDDFTTQEKYANTIFKGLLNWDTHRPK